MSDFRRGSAYIGFGSVLAFIVLLSVIPQLPYFHLLPWGTIEMDFEPIAPEDRPWFLLLFSVAVFLPLNGMVIFWGNVRRMLYHNQFSTLDTLSSLFLNISFMSATMMAFLGIYGEFYGSSETLPMIADAVYLSFILWALNLDCSALVLTLGMRKILPRRLFYVALGLILLQTALDLSAIAPNLPRWVYGISTLPLPSLIVILSAYWLMYSANNDTKTFLLKTNKV